MLIDAYRAVPVKFLPWKSNNSKITESPSRLSADTMNLLIVYLPQCMEYDDRFVDLGIFLPNQNQSHEQCATYERE